MRNATTIPTQLFLIADFAVGKLHPLPPDGRVPSVSQTDHAREPGIDVAVACEAVVLLQVVVDEMFTVVAPGSSCERHLANSMLKASYSAG